MLFEDALNIYTDGSMFSDPRAGGIGIVFVIINEAAFRRQVDWPELITKVWPR